MNMMMPGMMGMVMPYGMGGMGIMPGAFGVGMPTDPNGIQYYQKTGLLAPTSLPAMTTEVGATAYARQEENDFAMAGAVAGCLGFGALGLISPALLIGAKAVIEKIGKINPLVGGGLAIAGIAVGGLLGGKLGNYKGRNDFLHMDLADDGMANNSPLYNNALNQYYSKVQAQAGQGQ
jgi:hypothetical protein